MKENKKYLILILFLVIMIGGLSWAYFRAQIDEGVHLPINVTTDIPEELIFHIDHDLTLNVNQFTLTENGKNLTDSTKAQATYKAGTKNRKTEEYYVYLNISENTYIYTTTEEKPEILLKVEGPEGEIKTDLNNGEIHYNEELKGYDITTKKGLINIALDQEISSEGNEVTIDNWKFSITFINLETNQTKNANKTLKTQIIMQKDKIEPLTEHIKKLYTIDGENNLYYHDGTGEYENVSLEAGDNSYRYAGGDYHVTKKAINEGYNTIYDIIPIILDDGTIYKNNYWLGSARKFYLAYQEDQTSTSLKTLFIKAIND